MKRSLNLGSPPAIPRIPPTLFARLSVPTAIWGATVALGSLTSGCIGVPESRVGADGAPDLVRYCPNGTKVAPDGLLDDFEDGNTQLDATDSRGGYWWKSADAAGSVIGPDDFKPVPRGPDGSLAIHAFGKTAFGGGDNNWGAQFGANFRSGLAYDASKYVGIRFRARIGAGTTPNVRFKIGDINTHPDLGVCKQCYNHFGRNMTFTTDWREYEVFFASLEQKPYWGDPRPPSITPSKLYSFDFAIEPGATFDIWIDDIAFIVCK